MNQETVKRQQNDIGIEGLVLQLELAGHQYQDAERHSNAQKLAQLEFSKVSRLSHSPHVSPVHRRSRHDGG